MMRLTASGFFASSLVCCQQLAQLPVVTVTSNAIAAANQRLPEFHPRALEVFDSAKVSASVCAHLMQVAVDSPTSNIPCETSLLRQMVKLSRPFQFNFIGSNNQHGMRHTGVDLQRNLLEENPCHDGTGKVHILRRRSAAAVVPPT